jgi:chorismate mutase
LEIGRKMIAQNKITRLRKQIDKIDVNIVKIINRRFSICKKIGVIKKKEGIAIEDLKREAQILDKRTKNSSLDKKFTKKLFRMLFNEAKRLQK